MISDTLVAMTPCCWQKSKASGLSLSVGSPLSSTTHCRNRERAHCCVCFYLLSAGSKALLLWEWAAWRGTLACLRSAWRCWWSAPRPSVHPRRAPEGCSLHRLWWSVLCKKKKDTITIKILHCGIYLDLMCKFCLFKKQEKVETHSVIYHPQLLQAIKWGKKMRNCPFQNKNHSRLAIVLICNSQYFKSTQILYQQQDDSSEF